MIEKGVSRPSAAFQSVLPGARPPTVLPIQAGHHSHVTGRHACGAGFVGARGPQSKSALPFVAPLRALPDGAGRRHSLLPVANDVRDSTSMSPAFAGLADADAQNTEGSLHSGCHSRLQSKLRGALKLKPIMATVAQCLQTKMAWLTRQDFLQIVREVYDPLKSADVNDARYDANTSEMQLADGSKLLPHQPALEQLIKATAPDVRDNPLGALALDSLFLVVKAGTTRQELVQEITLRSGALGGQIFSDFLAASGEAVDVFNSDAVPTTRDMLIDLRAWQRAYDGAVLQQLKVESLVTQAMTETSLSEQAIFKKCFGKINKQFQQWADNGWIRRSAWLTPKLNRCIYNAVLQSVCARRYAQGVSGWLPGQGRANALAHRLREISKDAQVLAVADALEKGWIEIQVLGAAPFTAATYDLMGGLPSGMHQGIAVGPQIFVYCMLPAEGSGVQIDPRDHGALSMIVHEGTHALDWLKQPHRFEAYKQGVVDAVYGLERHAYLVQRQYLQDAMEKMPPTEDGDRLVFPLAIMPLTQLHDDIITMYGLHHES